MDESVKGGDKPTPLDAEVVKRYGRVPYGYEESSKKAIKWLEENRGKLTDIPPEYIDRMLHDLKYAGIAVLRSALYRCADLRDKGYIIGRKKN